LRYRQYLDGGLATSLRRRTRLFARSPLSRYGVAILCVAATSAFALLLRPAVMAAGQLSPVAIVITGWWCGLRPALLA
jgi:hypothetical protein